MGEADAADQSNRVLDRLVLRDPCCLGLGRDHALDGGEVREQVEPLEDHAHLLAETGEVLDDHSAVGDDRMARDGDVAAVISSSLMQRNRVLLPPPL